MKRNDNYYTCVTFSVWTKVGALGILQVAEIQIVLKPDV